MALPARTDRNPGNTAPPLMNIDYERKSKPTPWQLSTSDPTETLSLQNIEQEKRIQKLEGEVQVLKAALASLLPHSEHFSEEPPQYANAPDPASVLVRQTPVVTHPHDQRQHAVAEIGIQGYDHERYHMRDFVSTPQAQAHALRHMQDKRATSPAASTASGHSARAQASSHGPTGIPPFLQ